MHIISGITSAAPTHFFPFFLNIHQDTDGQPTMNFGRKYRTTQERRIFCAEIAQRSLMDGRLRPIFVREKRKKTCLPASVVFRIEDIVVFGDRHAVKRRFGLEQRAATGHNLGLIAVYGFIYYVLILPDDFLLSYNGIYADDPCTNHQVVSGFVWQAEKVLFAVIFHINRFKEGRARISEYNSQRGKRHQPSKAIINLNGHAY